ncbi:MAG: hypothetical protein GY940_32335 [bacterium]|nr:hypothetical protein [bacterium]
MVGRIQGKEYRLQRLSENGEYAWGGPEVELRLDENGQLLEEKQSLSLKAGTEINLRPFFMMKPILDTMIREPHTYAPVLLFHTEGGTFGI